MAVDYDKLSTERQHSARNLDLKSPRELVDLLHDEDRAALDAVGRAAAQIARAIDAITRAFEGGGRLFYVGAGTSGRLGVLDAAECPPTFSAPPSQVQAVIAGGRTAMTRAVEGAEDSRRGGAEALRKAGVTEGDVVCGITASGITPFVIGALSHATNVRATTVLITAGARKHVAGKAKILIRLDVDPEIIAGSTRMKAGLATKAVLHTLSSAAMIRSGRVYDNLMTDVRATNHKLEARAIRIIRTIAKTDQKTAERLLADAGNKPKVAVVMHRLGISKRAAERRLRQAHGRLREVID